MADPGSALPTSMLILQSFLIGVNLMQNQPQRALFYRITRSIMPSSLTAKATDGTHTVVFWFWKRSCKRPVDLYICTCPVKHQDYCALTKHHKLQPKSLHAEQHSRLSNTLSYNLLDKWDNTSGVSQNRFHQVSARKLQNHRLTGAYVYSQQYLFKLRMTCLTFLRPLNLRRMNPLALGKKER